MNYGPKPVESLASTLVRLANGIALMHRSGASQKIVDGAVDGALGLIEPGGKTSATES